MVQSFEVTSKRLNLERSVFNNNNNDDDDNSSNDGRRRSISNRGRRKRTSGGITRRRRSSKSSSRNIIVLSNIFMTGSNRNLLQPDLILRLIASVHNISPSAKLNFIV